MLYLSSFAYASLCCISWLKPVHSMPQRVYRKGWHTREIILGVVELLYLPNVVGVSPCPAIRCDLGPDSWRLHASGLPLFVKPVSVFQKTRNQPLLRGRGGMEATRRSSHRVEKGGLWVAFQWFPIRSFPHRGNKC